LQRSSARSERAHTSAHVKVAGPDVGGARLRFVDGSASARKPRWCGASLWSLRPGPAPEKLN